jgi:putative lipoic acid-binding regulatory protein
VTDRNEQRKLVYPHPWTYLVIGVNEEAMRSAVAGILRNRAYDVEFSRSSAQGKYVSLRVTMIVNDEGDRATIYQSLTAHPSTKIVI